MLSLLKRFVTQKQDCVLAYKMVGDPAWTPCKFSALCESGYQKNVYVYRAINLVSRSIASIPMQAIDMEKNEEDEEVNRILSHPNERQSKNSLIENIVHYLMISGNAFVYCDANQQLHCLRSDRVQIVPKKDNTAVSHYIYGVDALKSRLEATDVLHIKLFHPTNDWYGLSPLQVASRAIDQHNEMSNHNVSLLQNGGRPSGCMIVRNSENLTPEQREQLRLDIREAYTGTANSGKVMVLEGGLEWKEMGMSLKDLDFNEGKNATTREIAEAFGIPPVLLGIKGDTAFTSYREARMHFWEDTVLPLAELIRVEFNEWLSKKFNRKINLRFDIDSIHALASKRDNLWHRISAANFLTDNEKRQILGFPPLEEEKEANTINKE